MRRMGYVSNSVRQIRTLSRAEQNKILKFTGQRRDAFRDHMIISFALGTAMREGEIVALNVGDVVTGGKARARIELHTFAKKGRKKKAEPAPAERRGGAGDRALQFVFVPKLVRRKLEKFIVWKKRRHELVAPDAPLFMSNERARIAPRTVRHMFRTWQRRAGFETLYTFHELRHTSLTNLYVDTKDLLLVRRHARHRHVTTTQIYAHTSDEAAQRAIDKMIA